MRSGCDVTTHTDVTTKKRRIKEKLVALTTELDRSCDTEALKYLEKKLTEAYSVFVTLNRQENLPKNIPVKSTAPANKKMEIQKRFFSTKRKRVTKNKVRYARPTQEEKTEFLRSFAEDDLKSSTTVDRTFSRGKSSHSYAKQYMISYDTMIYYITLYDVIKK